MSRIKPRSIWLLLKEATTNWFFSDVFRLSASLSFFTVFSLAPLLIIILFFIGLFWEEQSGSVQERILDQISSLAGPQGAEMIGILFENAEGPGSGGLLATLIGLGTLLFGATVVFAQLQYALNDIWGIKPQDVSIKNYLLTRLLSFGLILAVGFLLLVSLVISAGLAAADEFINSLAPGYMLMRILNLLVTFGVITVLFAMIYRVLPDLEIAWREVWVGAVITALLFSLGKYLISLYLGNSSIASTYGAAGSLAVLLLWIYYSALIVFYGAEITRSYMLHFGRLRPAVDQPTPSGEQTAVTATNPFPGTVLTPSRPALLRPFGMLLLGVVVGRFFGRRG